MSETLEVVDAVLGAERAHEGIALSRIQIDVHRLVEYLVDSPDRYVLTRVDALVPAYERYLRSAAFYGDDVGQAPLFRENLSTGRLQCYSCGLRELRSRTETLRVSNKGVISFMYPSPQRVMQVERALGYVRELEMLHTEPRSSHPSVE